MDKEKIREALETIEGLISSYRSTLYNLTDAGFKEIDEETDKYRIALLTIEMELDL